jgi:very-short-patch-repair endonuclease
MVWDEVSTLTARQHGLVATRQAESVGGDEAWLRWAVADGLLERVRRGVYGAVGAPVSPFQPLMAAILAAGDGVVAGGLAAGWVWGAADIAPGALELLAFRNRCLRLRGVLVRRTELEPHGLVAVRNGIPVVIPPLAIIQLSRWSTDLALKVAKDLVKKGRTSYPEIYRCVDGPAGQRANAQLVRYVQRSARVRGHNDSPAAIDLGSALLDARLPPFVTQFVVSVPGGSYVLDYAWPEFKVGLEYNGRVDHGLLPSDIERDAERRNTLTALGWTMLDANRATSHAAVIRWVRDTLAHRQLAAQ